MKNSKRKRDDDSADSNTPTEPKASTSKTRVKKEFFEEKTEVSQVKHKVLKSYLGAWLAALSQNPWRTGTRSPNPQYSRIVYVDGFAGPGVYEDGEYGSPALAYELALTHTGLGNHGPPIYLIFVAYLQAQCKTLLRTLTSIQLKYAGAKNEEKVKFMVIHGDFVGATKWIISPNFEFPDASTEQIFQVPGQSALLESSNPVPLRFIGRDTPLMVFADSFGYNGEHMPMTLMREIMNVSTKSELFVKMVTGNFRRFWKLDSQAKAINSLTGNDESDSSWKGSVLQGENAKDKLKTFLQVYTSSLKAGCNKDLHTCIFEMRNKRNILLYNLVYASPHNKGFQWMKTAMRNASSNEALFKYSVFDVNNPDFEVKKVEVEDVKEMVLDNFEGKTVSGRQITEFIESQPDLDQHFKRSLKKELKGFCTSAKEVRKFDEQIYVIPVKKEEKSDDK